jgi:trehalose-6-phosphatase
LGTTQQKQQKEAVLEDYESTVFDLVEDEFVPLI